jgi:hypothetical protein
MKLIIVAFALLLIVMYKTDPVLSDRVDNYIYTIKNVVTDIFARSAHFASDALARGSNWARGH